MVVLVYKCVQLTHFLALHLETLGYIPGRLNALNGLVYSLIIWDLRGDKIMVGSISKKIVNRATNTIRGYCKFLILNWSHLCNIERMHHAEQSCEIILNLDQWFRRKLHLKVFIILSSSNSF